jgi:hypothetical protein
MSAQPIPGPHSRAESYRELAMQAINSVTGYKAQAERYAALGDTRIAAEYEKLANEAIARAERYIVLADFAKRNS